MDPNETWRRMCEIACEIAEPSSDVEVGEVTTLADELAELTLALRNWIASGGFPPAAFARKGA